MSPVFEIQKVPVKEGGWRKKEGKRAEEGGGNSWDLPKGVENIHTHRNLHMGVYNSFVHNCQYWEATKIILSEWINKL